ncbi:hypothetical protein ACU8KH_04572 [Lachancea thermotolerans]
MVRLMKNTGTARNVENDQAARPGSRTTTSTFKQTHDNHHLSVATLAPTSPVLGQTADPSAL